jgi:mycothiol synthase
MKPDINLQTITPQELTLRPPTMADLEPVVDFLNLTWGGLVGADEFDTERMRSEWTEPGFDLQTDVRLMTGSDGELYGYADLYQRQPFVRSFGWVQVHPEWRRPEVAQPLYDWLEARALGVIPRAPQNARVALLGFVAGKDQFTSALLEARGYCLVRRFLRMVIEMDGPPQEPDWPLGLDGSTELVVRTMRPGEETRVIEADRAAFRDHWGYVEQPLEAEVEIWKHRMEEPDFDPSLWFLVEDRGEIAGISLCRPTLPGHPEMGWVGTLGVLRPWRKMGLATALLYHSFGEFYRRGIKVVGLGVDAQSLTGATRLYEKVGMHIALEFLQYEKELRPGVELATTEI